MERFQEVEVQEIKQQINPQHLVCPYLSFSLQVFTDLLSLICFHYIPSSLFFSNSQKSLLLVLLYMIAQTHSLHFFFSGSNKKVVYYFLLPKSFVLFVCLFVLRYWVYIFVLAILQSFFKSSQVRLNRGICCCKLEKNIFLQVIKKCFL